MSYFDTPPLPIIDLPADGDHFVAGRAGIKPAFIVLHHTGGTDSRAWLSTTSSPPVSTHRLIMKDGTNYKIVDDDDTAYTAGYGLIGSIDPDTSDPPGIARNLNYASLNIELENAGTGKDPYPDPQMQMCARQVLEWMGKYGALPILTHAQVDPNKNDPRGFDRADLDRRIFAGITPVNVSPDFVRHLRTASGSAQNVVQELTAMLASLQT